jgi:hypothetical protein
MGHSKKAVFKSDLSVSMNFTAGCVYNSFTVCKFYFIIQINVPCRSPHKLHFCCIDSAFIPFTCNTSFAEVSQNGSC